MPAGKPKEWRWVANDDDDDDEVFDDEARGSDSHSNTNGYVGDSWWLHDGGWDSQSWNGNHEWQWQHQTSEMKWNHSDWQASKDDSMQWNWTGGGSATEAAMSTPMQQWPQQWPMWDGMTGECQGPLPSGPPGNWSHESRNKITMEEAIQWAEEETEKHEKAMRDGEEMAEVEVCLNAATAKAKSSKP